MSWSPLHRLSAGLDQAFADRVKRGLRAVDDADLLVDVADMVPHRLLADPQPVRDLLVSKPAGHQLEDLDLARGHAVRRLVLGTHARRDLDDAPGNRVGEHAAAGIDGDDAGDDRLGPSVLQDVATSEAADRLQVAGMVLETG